MSTLRCDEPSKRQNLTKYQKLFEIGIVISILEMFSLPEKGKAVLMYAETKSIVSTQRRFRIMFEKEPPSRNAIKAWYKLMWNTGCLKRKKRSVNEDEILDKAVVIQECVQETPSISVRKAGSVVVYPKTTVHRISRTKYKFCRKSKKQIIQKE